MVSVLKKRFKFATGNLGPYAVAAPEKEVGIMLYVFRVDNGTMMTFDMNLALESVGHLKDVIEKTRRIPIDKQVLLVSGGECLDPCAKVCSYSAGTDTNPIFLFSKCTLENAKPPSPSIDYGSDSDMKDLVDNSMEMPATYSTIVKRAQIAQQFCELAKEHTVVCESLVHDQHLQQQGWAAAVANLEDITAAFKSQSEVFEQNYTQYLENREENLRMLQNFSKDLQILAKIPILEPLMENALSFRTVDEKKKSIEAEQKVEGSDVEKSESSKENSEELGTMTLLMWISAADNQSSLEQVADQAHRNLEQFDENVLHALNREVETALETANKNEMKEIKGLGERLFGLEQLMVETKKTVQEQTDLAQALQQNQTRAGSLNDLSVLPDLCASHCKQLLVMLKNQHTLRDIRRRCSKAKEELSINLYHRLSWVMYVENLIVDVSNKLIIYHENLKRLRRHLDIIKQVQRTPQVYVAAVSEVVRRRTFSQAFLSWASDLSCRLLAVYNEEYEKRKDFQSQFEGHFLQFLFPGLEDNPPPFATQAPAPFDVALPQLTLKDMEQLQVYLPEWPMDFSVTKLSNIAQMFLTKSMTEEKSNIKENDPVEEQLVVAVTEAGLGSKLDKTLLQPAELEGDRKKLLVNKDDKDFESETDTEEFEKVCQSPLGVKMTSSPKFEEGASGDTEVQALRHHLTEAGKLANETAIYLKTELIEMKSQSLTDREAILALVKDIQNCICHLMRQHSTEVEALHNKLHEISQSNATEVFSLNQVVFEKEKAISVLTEHLNEIKNTLEETTNTNKKLEDLLSSNQQINDNLKAELEKLGEEKAKALQSLTEDFNTQISKYEEQLKKIKEEKDKEAAEEKEKLIHDHNNKMEEMKSLLIKVELDCEMEKEKTVAELRERLTSELNQKLIDMRNEIEEESEAKYKKNLKEASEQLTLEYKTEIENLRTRFKLISAAGVEMSPSESNLEKIERLDRLERLESIHHGTEITQMKELAEMEKEKAVKEAVEEEREKLQLKLEEELKTEKAKLEEEKQIWLNEAVNRALAEKNNQIEMLLARQEILVTECQKHKETIRLLTEGDQLGTVCSTSGAFNPLFEKIETLEKEKEPVVSKSAESKLSMESTEMRHVGDMSASVAVVPVTDVVSRDTATSPDPSTRSYSSFREKLAKSNLSQGKISITSCSKGDAVLVVWNVELSNYIIYQETPTLHFLHSDCLDNLGLRPCSDGSPRKLYCAAEVVEKEYCHAKKSGNRYKVPKGTKFYRVKVRPLVRLKDSFVKGLPHQPPQRRQVDESAVCLHGQRSGESAVCLHGQQSGETFPEKQPDFQSVRSVDRSRRRKRSF